MNGAGLNALDTGYLSLYGPAASPYRSSIPSRFGYSYIFLYPCYNRALITFRRVNGVMVLWVLIRFRLQSLRWLMIIQTTALSATALTLGVAASGTIDIVSDIDYFKVDLVSASVISLR